MNVPWRPNGWQYRCVWSILYTGTDVSCFSSLSSPPKDFTVSVDMPPTLCTYTWD